MEKQIILTAGEANVSAAKKISDITVSVNVSSLISRIGRTVTRVRTIASMPGRMLRSYYSAVLEREVSRAEARAITMTVVAFLVLVMPADYHLLLRGAALAWFLASARAVRNIKGKKVKR